MKWPYFFIGIGGGMIGTATKSPLLGCGIALLLVSALIELKAKK